MRLWLWLMQRSRNTSQSVEMPYCLHLWFLSNLHRIVSVARESKIIVSIETNEALQIGLAPVWSANKENCFPETANMAIQRLWHSCYHFYSNGKLGENFVWKRLPVSWRKLTGKGRGIRAMLRTWAALRWCSLMLWQLSISYLEVVDGYFNYIPSGNRLYPRKIGVLRIREWVVRRGKWTFPCCQGNWLCRWNEKKENWIILIQVFAIK